jgi:hypothetical protein
VTRWLIATAGALLALFGIFRLLTEIPAVDLLVLASWLAGALVVHDGILAPLSAAVGVATTRFVPRPVRAYVQAALVAGAIVTVIALPLVLRAGSQPPEKALLRQNYVANLAILLCGIAAAAAVLFAARVVRDRRSGQRANAAKVRPSATQISSNS